MTQHQMLPHSHGTPVPELEALLSDAGDDLPDLESLLGEAKASQREAVEAAKSRERLRKGGLTNAERQEDAARIRDWENKHEWTAQANVARYIESRCLGCNDYTYLFTGLFLKQGHRHLRDAVRWVKATAIMAALPNEIMVAKQDTPFCAECCDGVGFDWKNCYYEDGSEREADDEGEAEAEAEAELQEELKEEQQR